MAPSSTIPIVTQDHSCRGKKGIFNGTIDDSCVKNNQHHSGLDLLPTTSDIGVYASRKGTIVSAVTDCPTIGDENCNHGFGNTIIIKHDDSGYFSQYAHLKPGSVQKTSGTVYTGEKIAEMGQTGDVTGPHLHFELKNHGGLSGSKGTSFAYTSTHPTNYGYFDPWAHISSTSINSVAVKISNSAGVNVRRGPGTQYSVFTEVDNNQRFVAFAKVVRSNGDTWYRIHLPCMDARTCAGWIAGNNQGKDYSVVIPTATQVEVVNAGEDGLPVMNNSGSTTLDKIFGGQRFVKLGTPTPSFVHDCKTNWYEIYTPASSLSATGWVCGDNVQLTNESSSCGDANVFITQKTYSSTANETCTATTQLIAGTDVLLSSGAAVTYYAPQVVMKPGFKAAFGSYFLASTQTITAKIMLANPVSNNMEGKVASSTLPISESLSGNWTALDSILATIALHPPVINGITLDPQQLSGLDFDNEGLFWVFATTQDFVVEDQNGLSDIYLYNSINGSVALISHTENNFSGEGDSRYPVMDESGRYIVFQSQANNLLDNDSNPGSDIFIYAYDSDSLLRLSVIEEEQEITEFTHPAIDGAGLTLLYEGLIDKANGHIQVYDPVIQETSVITDNTSNYYYPAISRNGRYQAYLIINTHDGESCSIHWSDIQSGTETESDCGDININPNGLLRFSYDNVALEWRDSLWSDSKLDIKNPLY